MNSDLIQKNRDLRRYGEPSGFDGFFWAAFSLLLLFSLTFFLKEANTPNSALARQSALAAKINFLDPTGIWKLSRYPVWHISFAILYKLGIPFAWAAAVASALYLMLSFVLVQRVFRLVLGPESSFKLLTFAALVLVFAAAVTIPGASAMSLPPLWRNPALPPGFAASLLCLYYAAHCLDGIREQRDGEGTGNPDISWQQAGILAGLLLLSALSHPAFLRVFLPAWIVYLTVLFIKHPKCRRACSSMLAAVLPAAACAALQLSGSDVVLSLSLESVWIALRDLLLLMAFPLLALVLSPRKESLRDPAVRLTLLLAAAGVLEAALTVHAAGSVSQGLLSAAPLLWLVMLPRFIDQVFAYRYERLRLQEDARRGALPAAALARAQGQQNLKSLGFLAGLVLLLWQVYAGVYALYQALVGVGAL